MRKVVLSLVAGALIAFVNVTGASAISPKECQEAFKNGWTLTKEQTAQCQSASNNKHEEPVAVTNPGGQLPPGQQP